MQMLLILQSTTRPQKPRSSALFHSGLLPVEPVDPDDPDEADDPDDETTDTRPDRIAAVLLFLPQGSALTQPEIAPFRGPVQ